MKKIVVLLMILLAFCGCGNKKENVSYTYEIQSKSVDMSVYEGVSSTKHNFRLIVPSEFFKAYEAKSSGVFYLGRSNCGCCQRVCRYLDEVARDLNVTVYYIDAYNEEESLMDESIQDKLFEYMYPILGKDENNEKVLLTPHVFSLINGEYAGSQICFDGYSLDPSPSKEQIENFEEAYRKILEPFSQSN